MGKITKVKKRNKKLNNLEEIKKIKEIHDICIVEGEHPERAATTINIKIDMNQDLNQLIIGIKGTDSFGEAMRDAFILKRPYKNMKETFFVHSGFIYYYKKIQSFLHDTIERFKPKSIILGGESLGGALCLLAYEDIKYNFLDLRVDGYGFGIPKVFSFWNSKVLKERLKDFNLIEYGDDPVPLIFPICYKKYGNVIEIGERKYWRWLSLFIPKAYKDHMVYSSGLKKEIDKCK